MSRPLAQSWERSEDGLTWTFHLRRDVRWHDGASFTAHDVAFTFNRIIYNEAIPAPARANFNFRFFDRDAGRWRNAPMTVTALDDHTVQCVLPAPLATFLHEMGTPIYPKHVLEPHVDAGAFNTVWDINANPAEVIGTGPFTIASYQPGERIVLRRNPDYWLKDAAGNRLPYLDEIVRDIVPSVAAQLPRFRSGASDFHGVRGEEFAGLAPLQAAENFTIHRRGPGFGTTFLSFNMNPGRNPDTGAPYVAPETLEWFRNKQFRQAVAHVIDKDAIVNEIQRGLAYPQWSSRQPGGRATSTIPTSAGTNTTSPLPTPCWTASAGRTPTATASGKTTPATILRSRWSPTKTTTSAWRSAGSSSRVWRTSVSRWTTGPWNGATWSLDSPPPTNGKR